MQQEDSKVLILYSTVDGHTKSICERIAKKFKAKETVSLCSLEDCESLELKKYAQIVLGASVRYGNHRDNVLQFVQDNRNLLEQKRSAFFSVNLTARKPNKNTPDTNPYLQKFLKKANWEPSYKAVFAGKLDYPNYDCINRLAILLIMVITGGPKDVSQTYELTDWDKVDEFAEIIIS